MSIENLLGGSRMKKLKNARKHYEFSKIILLIMIMALLCGCSKTRSYDDIAHQFAQYDFGSDMPRLCYADSQMAILYDDHGIVVYNLKDRKITGYASFEGIDPAPGFQGDNAMSVRVSQNGKFVYMFSEGYPADGKYVHTLDEWREEKYLYDVSKDVFKQVDSYDEQFEQSVPEPELYEGDIDETSRVYSMGQIFKYEESNYCYMALKQSENEEKINYSNLRLVVNENGVLEEYAIFK